MRANSGFLRLVRGSAKETSLSQGLVTAFTQTHTPPELLTCEDREIFRAHLLRLDGQTRQERFGDSCVSEGFLDRYVQNINFMNTRLLGVFIHGTLRASAEIRSLHPDWQGQAELAIIVESCWQGLGMRTALFRSAISRAQDLGIRDLFISCNLNRDRPASFLRFLSKELRSAALPGVTLFDFLATRDEEIGCLHGFIRLRLDGRKHLYM